MAPFARLFAHYKAYHEHGQLLRYMGLMGLIAFPLLYAVRFVRPTAGYDDLLLRALDTFLCFLLVVGGRWPERLKPLLLPYAYVVMTVALPFTFAFTSLKNGGGPAAVGNTFFAAFMLMLVADWRNMIVMLVAGFGLATGLYVATDPDPVVPMDYISRLPVLVAGIVGGSLFKHALEQASADRVRRAYASLAGSIAHEMRNPLAQVRHSLEHIRQALPVPSLRVQQQAVEGRTIEQLYRHVSHGEMAVKRGLQVIAMTLDEVNAKEVDPGRLGHLSAAEVCAKAIEEFGYESEQQRARVGLSVREDFVFRGDESAFLFVLFNLLKNALYYLPAYPHATVELRVEAGRISVRDTGPGIAPELLEQLFQPFRTSGKESGTGLGLAYCRRVTRAFGGDITCQSVPGSHTEFSITFPPVAGEELQRRRQAVMAEARRLFADRRVLLVEDDASVRAATRQKLMELCCTVREAADGVEALQALKDSAYDLVVLDLNMPRMDGYEVAESVRRGLVPANRGTCLVAHTSEPAHLARVKTANAGFDGFVAKAVDPVVFVQALCDAMEEQRRRPPGSDDWLRGRRFLLADDNAYNRGSVAAYLRHAGAEVVEAASGQGALDELARGVAFDAVLLDVQMPGLDGVATARVIRGGAAGERRIPILAVTAHIGPDLMASGGAAGIDDFILKPVEAGLLFARLAEALAVPPPPSTLLPAVAEPAGNEACLDEHRLENYRRIGMLQEMVEHYVPQVEAAFERLQAAHLRRDFEDCIGVLHSIVGMSGEAGAQALYRRTRDLYVGMLEGRRWPADPSWLASIQELNAECNRQLKGWLAAHA